MPIIEQGRILVLPDKEKPISATIIAPNMARREQAKSGTIVAISEGVELKAGEHVYFGSTSLHVKKIDGVEYFMMDAESVLGVYE